MSYTPNQEKITVSSSGDLTISGAISSASLTTTGTVTASDLTTTLASPGNAISSSTGTVRISGDIVASGDITAFSDLTLKQNVEPIQNALDKVSALTGVTYDKDGKRSVGLIAQNVENIGIHIFIFGTLTVLLFILQSDIPPSLDLFY